MELWIRSQDKTVLINVKTLFVADKEIRGYYSDNPNWFLGIYKTKERALEVLDEIQERILNLQLVELEERGKARQDVKIRSYLECVYEMPQE